MGTYVTAREVLGGGGRGEGGGVGGSCSATICAAKCISHKMIFEIGNHIHVKAISIYTLLT